MRITIYDLELNEDGQAVLVKEKSKNCPSLYQLDNPEKIKILFDELFHAECKAEEYIWMLALNHGCRAIGIFEISHGTVNSAVISPREVFIRLCLIGAVNFVLVHNHPSGVLVPSKEDIKLTHRMKECGELMNIPLFDHIIIGNGYYSIMENHMKMLEEKWEEMGE